MGKSGTRTYLVEVAPLGRSPRQGLLSYFSSVRLTPGALVNIPVRKSAMLGLVTSCRDVRSAKSDIRRAGFLLKKIRKTDILEASIPPETLEAIRQTARYYASSTGALLNSLLPKLASNEPEAFLRNLPAKKRAAQESFREPLLLQMESEERFGQYRALVRQGFARGASVMFVVPTHLEIANAKRELSKGIEEFVRTFSLSGKKSDMKRAWSEALDEKHPILFITTPAGLLFPRHDLDTIIMERENSRAYRTLARPYFHLKIFIEYLAKASGYQLVMGDSILSLETLWREKNGEYGESTLLRWRLPAAPTALVDASTKQNENGRFEIFSKELKELIEKALNQDITASGEHSAPGRIFLFGARKGLAPTTVCGDCGFVLPCLNCGAGVVLHRYGEATVYVCHACGNRRESVTTCGMCGSWKLVPLGIGTEQIAREAKALFPGRPIHILDKDYAPTDKSARAIVKQFEEKGGVLVGTELAFFHLERVPYSGLVSVDTLFSVPDFSINERIFYLVSRLREMTEREAVIQTRNIGKQVLAWASLGNIIDFYQNEIEEREALLYPPFSIFIKITALKRESVHELSKLKERLSRWHPDIFKNSIVLRIARKDWPDAALAEELSLLGPRFSIKVDPESIL